MGDRGICVCLHSYSSMVKRFEQEGSTRRWGRVSDVRYRRTPLVLVKDCYHLYGKTIIFNTVSEE